MIGNYASLSPAAVRLLEALRDKPEVLNYYSTNGRTSGHLMLDLAEIVGCILAFGPPEMVEQAMADIDQQIENGHNLAVILRDSVHPECGCERCTAIKAALAEGGTRES